MATLYLKCRFFCILLLFFFIKPTCAQTSFTGKVINENDGSPIQNASVYFNNTTIATHTNGQGEFKFDNINSLNTELVIFCYRYELIVFKPTAAQLAIKRFIFKLHTKEIIGTKKEDLSLKLKTGPQNIFYSNFVGITEEAAKSSITNEKDIYFIQDSANQSFRVYSDTPIVIINSMLGYKMSYNLVAFFYNEITTEAFFTGYCRYEKLGDDKKYQRSRNKCYNGSMQHFYRSLIANQLYQKGFNTFLINPEVVPGDSTNTIIYHKENARPITAQQILMIDSSNNFFIGINGRLLVQYNKNPATKSYLSQIVPYLSGNLDKGIEVYIEIRNSPIELTSIGVPVDDTNISFDGFWNYERVANTLPYDYQPE